jgi:secreted PhoX family phosphatase
LTCEENYDQYYGERNFKNGERLPAPIGDFGWYKHYDYPPEHYGWVVEVDPKTGKAQKHVALGRCAHECATIKELEDGRLVVYTGDDAINQCLYKFISSKPGSLSEGTLYVANTRLNRWESLKYEDSNVLQKLFKNQTEVLIRLREAARVVGGSPLDRPEDIEIDPINGKRIGVFDQ